MKLSNYVILFTLFSSTSTFSLPKRLDEFKSNSELFPSIQNQENKCEYCFPGASCSEENYSCYCKEEEYYYNKQCQAFQNNIGCNLKEFKEKCKCPANMIRSNKKCQFEDHRKPPICTDDVSRDCGYGVCLKKKNPKSKHDFSCICFTFAELNDGLNKCVLKKEFCAGGELKDDKVHCSCTGKYTQADDGITCRLKTCSDPDVKIQCDEMEAECKMYWKEEKYSCECPKNYYNDTESGKCRAICANFKPKCDDTGGTCITNQQKVVQCVCKENKKYVKDEGCKDLEEECRTLKKKCMDTGGNCQVDDAELLQCKCPKDTEYVTDIGCKVPCSENKECEGNSECNLYNVCQCKDGYEGDDCAVVTGCKDLTEKCGELGVDCIFDESAPEKATCNCADGLKYNPETNECRTPCSENKECEGNRECNPFNVCLCKDGYEGDDCNTVTDCKDLQEKCDKLSVDCVFDETASIKATCDCPDGLKYDPQTSECRTENGTYTCDFEQGLICSFLTNDPNNKENWKIGTGKACEVDTGPFIDHTLGNANGSYIFVNVTKSKTNDVKLQTVALTDNYCVRFFYHMYGDDVGHLFVQVHSIYNNEVNNYFVRSQSQGDRWNEAQFSVNMDETTKLYGYRVIFFVKHRNASYFKGDIALDDIELKPGKCPNTTNEANALHTFDDFNSGFRQTSSHAVMKWEWQSATRRPSYFKFKPTFDHTLGTRYGGYWFCGSSKNLVTQWSYLYTPTYAKPKQTINCLHFYYNINANSADWSPLSGLKSHDKTVSLRVYCNTNPKGAKPFATVENTTALGQWRHTKAKFETTKSFYLLFDVAITTKYEVVVAIDDVQILPGDCQETDRCSSTVCENGGRCNDENGEPFCRCPPRFTGENCEIDKCSLITCENNGTCIIESGTAVCNCTDKYEGQKCETDKCSLITCENNGTCIIEAGKAVCKCTAKYTGEKCDVDKCSLITCENNGMCNIEAGKAVCKCTAKYTGEKCDVDKCSLITCENNGMCIIEAGKAVCKCTAKYTGEKCDIDKCSLITCENNGTCIIEAAKAVCKCTAKYTGEKCDVDKCSLIKCKNSGRCEIKNGIPTCICSDNYTGKFCEIYKCSLIKCQNRGRCEIKNGIPTCICPDDYTGKFCEILSDGSCKWDNRLIVILGCVIQILLIIILIIVVIFYKKFKKIENNDGGRNKNRRSDVSVDRINSNTQK